MKDIIERIRNTNFEDLQEVEKTILFCGLNNEHLNEQPTEFSQYYGKGLHMWQYPNQLAKFAKFISKLHVRSYMEVGCRFGGTFVFISEVLKRVNHEIKLYACDCIEASDILKNYAKEPGVSFAYFQSSSWDPRFIQAARNISPEMVFIDADHSWEGVTTDYTTFKDLLATKYFVFHDIANPGCPGIVKMWSLMKENPLFDCHEFTDQYESVDGGPFLGIGIAIRK